MAMEVFARDCLKTCLRGIWPEASVDFAKDADNNSIEVSSELYGAFLERSGTTHIFFLISFLGVVTLLLPMFCLGIYKVVIFDNS